MEQVKLPPARAFSLTAGPAPYPHFQEGVLPEAVLLQEDPGEPSLVCYTQDGCQSWEAWGSRQDGPELVSAQISGV